MRILSIIFPGRRLRRMANRARNVTRRAYGIAAGYYPPEYRRKRIPLSDTGHVRYTSQGFRTPDRPPTLSAYRPSGRAHPYQDAPAKILEVK